MTYRERRERRLEQRRDWAGSRARAADSASERVHAIADQIPFGQPILVGHHSEGRHRRDIGRIESGMAATVEHARMAEKHEAAAGTIEGQLARSIYDDDPDAVERLTEKVAGLEAKRDRMKQANADYRRDHKAELKAMGAYDRGQSVPFPSYAITNLGATIRTAKQRLERLQRPAALERPRQMLARFSSVCDECGETIEKGSPILYFKGERRAVHASHEVVSS